MYNLFEEEEQEKKGYVPLAEKMRPRNLDDFFGQEDIVGENSPIRKMLDTDNISSMIFYERICHEKNTTDFNIMFSSFALCV